MADTGGTPGLIKKKARGGSATSRVRWVVAAIRDWPVAAYEARIRRVDGCYRLTLLDDDRREIVGIDTGSRREAHAVVKALLGRMGEGGSERLRGFRWFRSESGGVRGARRDAVRSGRGGLRCRRVASGRRRCV
jgi:hypothetical protein